MPHRADRAEPAIAPGQDPRSYARWIAAVYDATMAGTSAKARPRRVIWDSWQRLMAKGLRPDHRVPPVTAARSTLDEWRQDSGLATLVEDISQGLAPLTSHGEHIVAITDASCRVLWRSGAPKVLRNAERLGFVEGAQWAEATVGTNALGTALVSRRAVQTFCAEHYNRSQHPWTCAAAPVRSPRTGQVMGIVDVTGPASTVHPSTVALVDAVARLAESNLHRQHDDSLNRLRAVAAPILSRIDAPAMAVDADGWVAAVDSMPMHGRILLPADITAGNIWVPELGACDVDTLPGGWLLRPVGDDPVTSVKRVTLDLRDGSAPVLELEGQFGRWRHDISLRHAEILAILSAAGAGRSAPELAADLYGDPTRVGAVRVEMSRLRKLFAGITAARPYRIADGVQVEVRRPENRSSLLVASNAPAVRAMRTAGLV